MFIRRCWEISRAALNVQFSCMMAQNRLTNKNLVLNDYYRFFQDPMICPQLTNLLGIISWMDMVISKSNKMFRSWEASVSAEKRLEELRRLCTATYELSRTDINMEC